MYSQAAQSSVVDELVEKTHVVAPTATMPAVEQTLLNNSHVFGY